MFGIHETFGAYIDDSLIAVLATLGSFGKLVGIGLLAIIGFSMFRCEKITVLVKGTIAMIFDQSLQAYLHEVDDVFVAWEEKPSGNYEVEAQLLAANYHKNRSRILAFILPHLQEFYGYFTGEEATEKLSKPIIEPERQSVTFCDQTFDDIHIFSFDYQGQAFESLENFAIDG